MRGAGTRALFDLCWPIRRGGLLVGTCLLTGGTVRVEVCSFLGSGWDQPQQCFLKMALGFICGGLGNEVPGGGVVRMRGDKGAFSAPKGREGERCVLVGDNNPHNNPPPLIQVEQPKMDRWPTQGFFGTVLMMPFPTKPVKNMGCLLGTACCSSSFCCLP